ncbi:MAG: hypothetical protein EHM45_12050 [Desulfobacteraceae bacterium]|nr:MAG: hypothetical protein EHM45_12050 [Desulfobacteraceae bacterium]
MSLKILQDTESWTWPENAAEKILAVLRDVQAPVSERLLAADLAGNSTVINDALADALLETASNQGPEDLRAQAAIALGPALEYAYLDDFEDPDDLPPISEETYHKIQETLQKLFMDSSVPKEVRRRTLEAAVRSPQDWHIEAIRTAYANPDDSWKLTAVFCMRFVRGFKDQILEALKSKNKDIHYEAVCAAGDSELEEAWLHISSLITSKKTEKSLLLAAIDAVSIIRPREAGLLLGDLIDHKDQDIVDAAYEAISMAEGFAEIDPD